MHAGDLGFDGTQTSILVPRAGAESNANGPVHEPYPFLQTDQGETRLAFEPRRIEPCARIFDPGHVADDIDSLSSASRSPSATPQLLIGIPVPTLTLKVMLHLSRGPRTDVRIAVALWAA
jgi:hypothetical protein